MSTTRQTAIGAPIVASITGRTSSAAVPASRAMWNGSTARTRYVYSAKSVSAYTARGTATVSTVAVAPICAS